MSVSAAIRRVTPPEIRARKGGQPLVCLTAYTAPVARIADAECDVLLVCDSLGMVLYGLPSTLGVSAGCDGQILVIDDMLGLFTDFRPRFVRRCPGPEHVFADDAP